jgi:hypothetical protein
MDKFHRGLETADDLACIRVPEVNLAVAAADNNPQAIGGQCQTIDDKGKPGEMTRHLASGNIPDAHAPIDVFLEHATRDGGGAGPFGSGSIFLKVFTDADAATGSQDTAAVPKKGTAIHPALVQKSPRFVARKSSPPSFVLAGRGSRGKSKPAFNHKTVQARRQTGSGMFVALTSQLLTRKMHEQAALQHEVSCLIRLAVIEAPDFA